jgi:hypothetical protein
MTIVLLQITVTGKVKKTITKKLLSKISATVVSSCNKVLDNEYGHDGWHTKPKHEWSNSQKQIYRVITGIVESCNDSVTNILLK